MNLRRGVRPGVWAIALMLCTEAVAHGATIDVPAGGDLQSAITAARPGDTIVLAPGATYIGNFRLPAHGGTSYITIRSAAPNSALPAAGQRMAPSFAPQLPKLISPNNAPALRTVIGAAYWRIMLIELSASTDFTGVALALGDGSTSQSSLPQVAHHLEVDRVYIHGHAAHGLRRGVALNSAHTTVINSHISDIKAITVESQAIGGWNGPGPYRIENNYLESAGEVIMFGGDDPKIAGLVPSDITIRGNTLTRPVSWRAPIVATPANLRASTVQSGGLPPGTYAYRVLARRKIAADTARSLAASQVTVTTGATGGVLVQWSAVSGATEYLVYGRSPSGLNRYWSTTQTSFVDDGWNAGTAATVPTSGTVWQVKNILELKNARRVLIDYNLMENHWAQSQSGIAILFTPRNQNGVCTWCAVDTVTLEYNIVRKAGGGIMLLGWDDERPSGQLRDVVIRHNQFSAIDKSWGGSGHFLYLIDGPSDVRADHNTFISSNGSGVIMADKRATTGFVFTNNVMRHNTYGIIGTNTGVGLSTISRYFPGSEIRRNVLAGGAAKNYPPDNVFPSVVEFEAQFADYATGDYTLTPDTLWANAGTDGKDLGVDNEALGLADPPPAPSGGEVVLTAAQATRIAGDYQWRADATAAGGTALWNPNRAAPTIRTALSSPATFAEFTFAVDAGTPYYVWLRGRAEWNDPANDSVHVQFTNVAEALIGTTSSLAIVLEEGALAGLDGWGWQDRGYGAGVVGAPIVFSTGGTQTLRLQPREDGFLIDQIVISPSRTSAPGATKRDTTILKQH
jgi:hypothetical protein